MAKNQTPDYRKLERSCTRKLAQQMVLLGSYEDFDFEQIIEVLRAADDAYHNSGDPLISDKDYDAMRRFALKAEPHNSYFTGAGSSVRGGKVKLPYQMGSLDQIEVGGIEKWVTENDLKDEIIIPTEKLDGVSAMVIYDEDGMFQIAYSRGDGIEGADISRHVRHLVPKEIENGEESHVIRGEIIISKKNFPIVQSKVRTSSGKVYKNARNMVAGCMNASSREKIVYDYIEFVAYQIVKPDDAFGRADQLFILNNMGFKTVKAEYGVFGRELDDEMLADMLNDQREVSEYEIDGLVLDVDNLATRERMNPTRDTLNPAFAIKYKVQDASNLAIATVVEVQWNASKHGYLKPRVKIEPIQLVGVTIQHATGFNAKFIYDNGIGPGAKVQITRSGDVIPFIQDVIESTTPMMPSDEWEWNETGVDAKLTGDITAEQVVGQMVAFFDSIDAPLLKDGNCRKLYDMNFDVAQVIQADKSLLLSILGANGAKVHAGLVSKLTNIPLYRLLGAFSNERGLGVRKMKKLQEALGHDGVLDIDNIDQITGVDGFEYKTALKVVRTIAEFLKFARRIHGHYSFDETGGFSTGGGEMDGQKVVFTGFRDKALQEAVESAGGTMQSSVSGKTTILVAANPTSNSGKMKKARDMGVRIIGVDEMKDELGV